MLLSTILCKPCFTPNYPKANWSEGQQQIHTDKIWIETFKIGFLDIAPDVSVFPVSSPLLYPGKNVDHGKIATI